MMSILEFARLPPGTYNGFTRPVALSMRLCYSLWTFHGSDHFFWSGWMVMIAKSNILCKMNVNISRQQATSVLSDSSPENAPYSSLPPLMDVSWLGRSWWSSTPGLQLGKRVKCDQTKSNIETFFSQRAELEVAPASRELLWNFFYFLFFFEANNL